MKNNLLKSLFLFNGLFVFAGSLLGPLYAVYVLHLGDGVVSVSTSSALFVASTSVFIFLVSKFKDGESREEDLLRAGYILRSFVWFGYAFIHSIPQLFLLQIINGLGAALGSPAFDTLFAQHLEKNKHLKDYANYQLLTNIVTAIGTFTGGLFVAHFGFIPLFYIMGSLALVSLLGFLKI